MGGVNSCGSASASENGTLDSTRKYLQIDSLIICPLCTKKYKDPRMLKCQHTFCYQCIKSHVYSIKQSGSHEVTCPLPQCRTWLLPAKTLLGISVDKWGTYFPKNITISKILENLPNDEEYCDVHEDKLYEYFCEDDRKLSCSTCVINYHKKCDNVRPISEFTDDPSKFEGVCKTLIADLKKSLGQSHTIINQLKNNVQKLEQQRDVIFNDLEKFRLEIINELDRNEKVIKEKVNELIDEKYEQVEILENLEGKFAEYMARISNHRTIEAREKLRSLQIVDKFTAQDVVMLKSIQTKFKTVNIEFVLDPHKETHVKKQLKNIVLDHFLVTERAVY
ncbi:hypothetical protein ACF0H5_017744 [Mactra antiquata]